MELWPGKVPDEAGNIGAEKVVMSPALDRKQVEVPDPTRMVTNVSDVSVTIDDQFHLGSCSLIGPVRRRRTVRRSPH